MEKQADKPFVIYRSSAGSGKTYTLAREYVSLALTSHDYFSKILAVTFTNKAAEEMKSRVLDFLKGMASGEHELLAYFEVKLGRDKAWLSHRATGVLSCILHNYSRVAISTIDTFFHKVIRSFAREIGLQGGFQIELDTDVVLDAAVDMLLEDLQPDTPLANWLTQFARTKLQEGTSYEFREDIKKLAKMLFGEQFKSLDINLADEVSVGDLQSLQKALTATQRQYESQMKKFGGLALDTMARQGLGVEDFAYGNSGVAGVLQKLRDGGAFEPGKRFMDCAENASAWYVKKSPKGALIHQLAENELMPLLHQILEYHGQQAKLYNTTKAINQYLYAFGILQDISTQINRYKEENEVILITDLPDFLRKIIRESDAPFIYEKFGNRYQHFLIDEFQDTSAFQWDNFKPLIDNSLASGNFNMIVGDVKQSIYRWRGGDWQLLLEKVASDIGEERIKIEPLDTNYRSLPGIINFNNELFATLPSIIKDHLQGNLPQDVPQSQKAIIDAFHEKIIQAYQKAEQRMPEKRDSPSGHISVLFEKKEKDGPNFKELGLQYAIASVQQLQDQGYAPCNIALLVRSNTEAKDLVATFLQKATEPDDGYCYDVVSADAMYLNNSYVVNLLITIFKYLMDEGDKISLAHIAYDYSVHVKDRPDANLHQLFAWTDVENHLPRRFSKQLPMLRNLPLFELVETLIRIFDLNTVSNESVFLRAFQDTVLDYSKSQRGDLHAFMDWWDTYGHKRTVQLAGNTNAIQIITVHKSKGLQFPAVILPFCCWEMDHNTSHDNILWVNGEKAGTGPAPHWLPIKYSGNLPNTHYSTEYFIEQSKAYMESLNVLYVATTRAESVLMLHCETPSSNSESKTLSVSKLLANYFEQSSWEKEEVEGKIKIVHGDIPAPPKSKKDVSTEMAMPSYTSSIWREKIAIRKKSSPYFNEVVRESIQLGITVHELISRLKDHSQLDNLLAEAHASMGMSSAALVQIKVMMENILANDQLKKWFAPGLEAKTETAVLLPDGSTHRPDRVVFDNGRASVIDFKTGLPKPADQRQVQQYINMLQEMGHANTEGYLVYLADLKIEKVA